MKRSRRYDQLGDFSYLPYDIQIALFQFLDGKSLLRCTQLNSYWKIFCNTEELFWKPLCNRMWQSVDLQLYDKESPWKQVYKTNNNRWCFVSSTKTHSEIVQFSKNSCCIHKVEKGEKRYVTVLGSRTFHPNTGIHTWYIRINGVAFYDDVRSSPRSYIFIGICSIEMDLDESLAFSHFGWSYCKGYKWHQPPKSTFVQNINYGIPAIPGDTIGVTLDTNNRTLSFLHNNEQLGIAYSKDDYLSNESFLPAVSLDEPGDEVEVWFDKGI